MPIDTELLQILACPGCKAAIKLVVTKMEGRDVESLVCQNPQCGLQYPIREGIPVMLIDEAAGPQSVKDKYK